MARPTKTTGAGKSARRATSRNSSKKAPAPASTPAGEAKEAKSAAAAAQLAQARSAQVEAALAKVFTTVGVPTPQTLRVAGVDVRCAAVAGARPHWLFVTHGLLPVGFELSFRVLRPKEELAPPTWVTGMLASLIERAPSEGVREGQVVNFAQKFGAGLAEIATDMQAVVLGVDPLVGSPLVQVAVGLTRDEERLVREWSPRAMFELLAKVDPQLVTDLERASTLVSPRTRGIIEQRVEAEGSSLGVLWVEQSTVSAKPLRWSVPADAVETLLALLKGRIGHLRPFSVTSNQATVEVVPADAPSVERSATGLVIKLNQSGARQWRAQLKAAPGVYAWESLPDFSVEVREAGAPPAHAPP